jgi:hypothetical protein
MTNSNDVREALFNEQATGPAGSIQLPQERITSLHGVFFDLDPKLMVPGNRLFPPSNDPRAFYQGIKPVLDRHALARHAEVRASGTGLHLIVWLQPAVQLHSAAEQQRWDGIIQAVQCSLPSDPQSPGITGLTRPEGVVNTKNGATVEVLQVGTPVAPKAVEEFAARLIAAPFREIAQVLLGADRVSPCPVCAGEGTRLDVLDRVGMCYGGCGKVSIEHLYDTVLLPVQLPAKRNNTGAEKKTATGSGKAKTAPKSERRSANRTKGSANS